MGIKKRLVIVFVIALTLATALCGKNSFAASALSKSVYAGGFPIAMVFNIDGAIIDEVSVVKTAAGNASLSNKLRRGDTITEIDGIKVSNCEEVVNAVEGGDGDQITLTLLRDGKQTKIDVTPYIESDSGLFKLGIYIRDTISGVGTVSFVKSNGYFGALGHKIVDAVATCDVPISGGEVYDCDIIGVTKSKRNSIGELRATPKGESIGEIFSNSTVGVFGRFYDYKRLGDEIPFGNRSEVLPGKAYVITTVDGEKKTYEVDIIRAISQNSRTVKGILIRVTDKRLLELSGGIVQGMSGSPLLQNGKIVGAVTHVLINDPTKGYAIYTDWMQSA